MSHGHLAANLYVLHSMNYLKEKLQRRTEYILCPVYFLKVLQCLMWLKRTEWVYQNHYPMFTFP